MFTRYEIPILIALLHTVTALAAQVPAGTGSPAPVADAHRLHLSWAPRQNAQHTFPNRLWLDATAGLTAIGGYMGTALGGNLHYLDRQHRHYQLRYVYTQDLAIMGGSDYGLSDAGYLFGWMRARRYGLIEAAIGLSCVWGYRPGREIPGMWWSDYRQDRFVTVGIPAEIDVKLMARRYAGIGLSVKANLNPKVPYALFGIELAISGPN